ncbi:PAS domain-containing protein [Pedobacter deserti]|uniref:PAS domain-containing protein n=1 Tax=Pedobacter deserti TaxID=2817382 RepID=UPI00210D1C41|nr:PAS domain-containing protein [Pedobacter sp. SYSU D00382]
MLNLDDTRRLYNLPPYARQDLNNYAEELNDTMLLMSQAQELARFGNWSWDIINNRVTWSDSLYDIYGLDKHQFKATFEGYQELLHPDDRKMVYDKIQRVLSTHEDTQFDERIVRPGGEIRFLRSWGRLKCENGVPQKMIGACLDITETEQQNRQLRDIAWAQTHLVRAPLARVLGIVELLNAQAGNTAKETELLNYLNTSAKELDDVIRDIIKKSLT